MSMLSLDELLKARLPEAVVHLEGMGDVRVRGLSRAEVMLVRKATDDSQMDGPRALTLERKLLAAAMVDPPMSEAQVGQWQKAAPAGELGPVTEKIQELSGMVEGASKSGVPGDGGEPGPGVRPLPSPEAGRDDGGGDAPPDEQ